MKHFLTLLLIATLNSQPLFAAPFMKGHYYTVDGKRVEGLIKLVRSSFSVFGSKPCSIRFKEKIKAKTTKLSINDMTAFVIEQDSFALVYNIKINSIQGEYVKDFSQVHIVGAMNLFIHKSTSGDGRYVYDNNRYIISKDNKIFLGIWNEKKQREEIANFFSDSMDIKQRILNKKNDINILDIVKEYNKVNDR
jgi:hypothetical protein